MAYHLRMLSDSTGKVLLGRDRIGHVVRKHDGSGWYGAMQVGPNKFEFTGRDARTCFQELVRKANRVSLCGVDDAEKARVALEERNAMIERRNEEERRAVAPLVEEVFKAFRFSPEMESKLRHNMSRRRRGRKILL